MELPNDVTRRSLLRSAAARIQSNTNDCDTFRFKRTGNYAASSIRRVRDLIREAGSAAAHRRGNGVQRDVQ